MNELFEAIKGKKFAVFGRAGIDLFCDEVGVKSENSQIFRSDLGGSSANICAGLVKLGSQASLITSVSDDAIGRFALNRLRDYGVDTKYVKTISGECRTSLAIYESTLDNFQNQDFSRSCFWKSLDNNCNFKCSYRTNFISYHLNTFFGNFFMTFIYTGF